MQNKQRIKIMILAFISMIFGMACQSTEKTESKIPSEVPTYAMVIHGGAGVIQKENMSDQKEQAYRQSLSNALEIGEDILKSGGSSLEAVEKVIMFLENDSLYNAGKGAVFTSEEKNELDASVMRGSDLQAGAVGGITNVKNPIQAAIAVMEKSDHVFMVGQGAEKFSELNGLEIVDPSYFRTERRWNTIQRVKANEEKDYGLSVDFSDLKFGTVGCVALDNKGDIVAGTSTGGMTNKKYNRIGDSPVIGAGTYADNKTCGVSCTGHGEFFIRYAVAHDLSAAMSYGKMSLKEAGEYIINDKLKAVGGDGGLVALDRFGNIAMPFNTAGMYRAYVKPGEKYIGIFDNE